MYTRKVFGKALKEKIIKRQDIIEIGEWAFEMYFEHMMDI